MKKVDLSLLPKNIKAIVADIGAEADKSGKRVYLVGGMVRDLLLGRPSTDIDIVVEGDACAFARKVAAREGAKAVFHEKFRTASLTLKGALVVDVVTARSEAYSKGGALPEIVPSTIKDDLLRRDFTVNALAAGLNADNYAVLLDDVGGCEDIEERLIRVMHEQSFIDDPTRILRAVRYAVRFGFQLEALTQDLLDQGVAAGVLGTISAPRYFLEFRRILDEDDPVPALDLLAALGAVRYVPYDAEGRARLVAAGKTWEDRLAALLKSSPADSVEEKLVAFNIPRAIRERIR